MNKKWTTEKIKIAIEDFKNKHGHYPSTPEMNSPLFSGPSPRTIQRKFTSVVKLRELLNLPITDFTRGHTRSEAVKKASKLAAIESNKLYQYLVAKLGVTSVHREFLLDYPYTNKRCDFCLFTKINNETSQIFIDCFYNKDRASLINSLNIKIKNHRSLQTNIYTKVKMYYINLNEKLDISTISNEKLLPNEYFFNLKDFKCMV